MVRPLAAMGLELGDLVLPRPCPGCGRAGPLCADCAAPLAARPREPVLSESSLDNLHEALRVAADGAAGLPAIRALGRYTGGVRAAIIAGKERHRRDLPPVLGAAVGTGLLRLQRIGLLGGELVVVPAPTRTSAARRRGGDPVHRMARTAAAVLAAAGTPTTVAPLLSTAASAADQGDLDAAGRAANLTGRIRVAAARPAGTGDVVLLDDVLTSGATVTAACAALAGIGLPARLVLVVASVPPLRGIR